jgi:hypothetical protein
MNLLGAFRPEFASLESSEVWGAQKAILLSGALFAVMFAGFRAFLLRHNPSKNG